MAGHSNLYVYGLPPGTDDEGLRKIFEGSGTIVSVRSISDRRYGFVKYATTEESHAAIGIMNGQMVNGSRLTVMAAQRDQGEAKACAGSGGLEQANGEPIPCPTLLVRGLPPNFTPEHIRMVFEMYGIVTACQVLSSNDDTLDGIGESSALLSVSDMETATWMVTNINGNIPQGLERPLSVTYATDALSRSQMPVAQGLPAGTGALNRYSPYDQAGSNTIALPSGQSIVMDNGGSVSVTNTGRNGTCPPVGKGYKTRLCTYFTEKGFCPSGESCTFAHGGEEVKGFRTRMCKYDEGKCPQGDKCSFAHSGSEVKGYKTRMCKFEVGKCPAGNKCSFAHGSQELQAHEPMSSLQPPLQASSASSSSEASAPAVAPVVSPDMAAALSSIWSALSAGDLGGLATLGIDVNALAALSQAAHAANAPCVQPALGPQATAVVGEPMAEALGNGAAVKGPGSKGSFKTRLCTYFVDQGTCPNGDNCTFAHGPQEIHGWKTRMCKFADSGSCPQGTKCSFAHSASELVQR
mmetsp:Transcript_86404/g.200965  ORF Transcript_86404/g.200965 Transcript_86404/m.200965 type:complete len:522 (-) Transcript_86404:80-1645(-)